MSQYGVLKVSVVTPARLLFEGDADSLTVPTTSGLIGILPGHAPLLSMLGYGLLTAHHHAGILKLIVYGGFLEVKGNHVTVLAGDAELPTEADLENLEDDLAEANALPGKTVLEQEHRASRLQTLQARRQYGQKKPVEAS
ncbi:MAG: ATP synthase F1 subunit epsilon [Spirochaetia bacterium]|nr:ATP synthase F1 subunit epsilon [Spirochaetia bacterium]